MDAIKKAEPVPSPGCPRQSVEQALGTARHTGDRCREASALADLGLMHLYEGDAHRAVTLLEEAWVITRQLDDGGMESDVIGNLGLAAAAAGQPDRALALLDQSLFLARGAGDP